MEKELDSKIFMINDYSDKNYMEEHIKEYINKLKIDCSTAMTGEITLRGDVLPIGGLKEKSIAATRNNIKKIIIPYENEKDLEEIPNEVKDNIEFVLVKNYNEVYKKIGGK